MTEPAGGSHRLAEVLEAVGFAADRFLGTRPWEEVVDEVLARLGRAADASRLYVFENHRGPGGELLASQRWEWTAPDSDPQIHNPDLQGVPYEGTGFERWRDVLSAGDIVAGDVSSLPPDERSFLAEQGITSLAVVPVFTDEAWWGFMGYDETRGDRRWSPTELQALRTAADTFGTAIRRRRMEAELAASRSELIRLALYDALTGLPNRSLFEDRLDHALERSRRSGRRIAVLFLDLDRFKIVNDTLGHAAGDQLLVSVAGRLEERLREEDTLARFGGDEFACLLEGVGDREQAETAVRRLVTAFDEPFELLGTEVHVGGSVGLALSSEELSEPEDLLRFSDIAMYRAKETEGVRYHLFDPTADEGATMRLHRENRIRIGLQEGEFLLYFQPVVELATGRIVGAEALARWAHPEAGLLTPDTFVPLAEESGLIHELDSWVLQEAVRTTAKMREEVGRSDLGISVNLSPQHLRHPELPEEIQHALGATGLPAEALELEITERSAMQGMERLGPLRDLGLRISIDDLGTGYSSLEYLTRLEVDTVKVDRAFVGGLTRNRRDRAVVESLLLLARRLELNAVAEGIETRAQRDLLSRLECPHGQGFWFARPAPAGDFLELLQGGRLPA